MATDAQIALLHHTLGVTPKRREPYRNHFVASEGHHDMLDLKALESAGLMARSPTPKFCPADDIVFHVTAAGRAYALENLAQPPKLTRYGEYLDADYGHSFAEWLGINPPRVEWNHRWGKEAKYRFVRLDWQRHCDVAGEWKPTKKEAKASYKEKLAEHRATMKKWSHA